MSSLMKYAFERSTNVKWVEVPFEEVAKANAKMYEYMSKELAKQKEQQNQSKILAMTHFVK